MRFSLARSALVALPLALASFTASPLAAQLGSPAGPIPVTRLQARREALLKRMGQGVAIIRSAEERSIEGDYPQDSDYREDNDFFYLTGLEAPGCWLVLIGSDTAPGRSILYLPPRDSTQERWTGPKLGPGPEATAQTGIGDTRPATRATEEIRNLVAGSTRLFLRLSPRTGESGLMRELVFGSGVRLVEDLNPHLAALRLVKDADEVARLRRAIEITDSAVNTALRSATPGAYEYEIESIVEAEFRRQGAERLGYPSIVASGINGTTLHYDKNRRKSAPGDLVVADVGAEFGYYTADVTRTFPITGKFTPRQRALYDLVQGTQQAAIDSVRPGITIQRLNQISREYMRSHSGDLCGGQSCDRYFPHSLSHYIGMDVHDVGEYGPPLPVGAVITVEPGIYIPEERLGIRIEDDVLVTATGHEVLSGGSPRGAAEVEKVMAEGRKGRK